jgi:hypothetical protein
MCREVLYYYMKIFFVGSRLAIYVQSNGGWGSDLINALSGCERPLVIVY